MQLTETRTILKHYMQLILFYTKFIKNFTKIQLFQHFPIGVSQILDSSINFIIH